MSRASSPPCRIAPALLSLLVLLGAGACERPDPRAALAYALEGEEAPVDPVELQWEAEEVARQDSLAAWEARFGDRVPTPDSIRALYLNAWAAGSRARMAEFLELAGESEINAFVIDIKEVDSYLTHAGTRIPLAREIGAHGRPASDWLPELVDTLKANGIYPIARIVVFKDEMLATRRPDLAIRHVEGGVFRDRAGNPWVNPYDERVWDYNIEVAREALDMGFSELQWDYVRFPDVPSSLFQQMRFPGRDGRSRVDAIRAFVAHSREELAEYRVPITADVFGLVTHVGNDLGIGQQWEALSPVTDALLPMVYPSHYYAGSYGLPHPNAEPYRVVRIAMEEARLRNELLAEEGHRVARIVPWLQAFSAPWVDSLRYDATHVREQVQATYDAGLTDWVLWHPGSRYGTFRGAFRGPNGERSPIERAGWVPTRWDPPAGRLSPVIAQRERERQAARARIDAAVADVPPPGVHRPGIPLQPRPHP